MDNKGLLLDDTRINQASAENLALIFQHTYWRPHGESGLYRPVTTLWYLFNYAILSNRDRAARYHSINLALHFGNVLLVYCLARRLIGSAWSAALIAAVWRAWAC